MGADYEGARCSRLVYMVIVNKIQYMFPKAHAAAYVMMAWRVAYCKVFYPLAYYCAYYSIRANAFDYEKCNGKGTIGVLY